MAERDIRTASLTLAGDGLLLLCALAGFTGSFLTLYTNHGLGATPLDLCAARWDSFLFIAALFALLSLTAWSLPRFRWAAAGGLALLTGTAAVLNWESAVHGAGITIHIITAIFSLRVSWGWTFEYDPGLPLSAMPSAIQLFLVLALAVLALVLGWAVVRARRWWIAPLLTLPPLLPGLLADLYPDWLSFMALCACWCVMLLCDLCKWAAPRSRGRLVLVMMVCVSIVLTTITLAFPRDGYTRPRWALGLEAGLQSGGEELALLLSRWDGPFGVPVTYVGAAGEADLASAGPLNYTGRTVLRVDTDYEGRLYLRGTSLAVYEDGVWTGLPEGAYQEYLDLLDSSGGAVSSPLLFPALQALRGTQYTATVENVGAAGSCAYLPYYPDEQAWEELGMLPVEDAYFARLQGQRSFTMTFCAASPNPGGSSSRAEQAYHNLIREHYLDVPEELREPLEKLCRENGLSPESLRGSPVSGTVRGHDVILDTGVGIYAMPDPVDAARQVAAVLDGLCEYDSQTPAAPAGADPVEYFLFESRRGYCMHYASAAALMLRAMGIPARYVSGFTADCVPGRQASVPDRAAHAWVEVWVNGFGWRPVEVTPAAAFDWYSRGSAQPSPTPSEDAEESEPPEPTPTPEPSASDAPSAQPSAGADGPADSPGPAALFAVLKALAAIAGLSALLWLGQWLPKRLRAKKLSDPDRNRAVLDGYGYLRRLERWGGRMDPRAEELAQKARFSQHTLTAQERDELRALVDRERARLCTVLRPVRRLAFRYLWGGPAGAKNRENPEKSEENTP